MYPNRSSVSQLGRQCTGAFLYEYCLCATINDWRIEAMYYFLVCRQLGILQPMKWRMLLDMGIFVVQMGGSGILITMDVERIALISLSMVTQMMMRSHGHLCSTLQDSSKGLWMLKDAYIFQMSSSVFLKECEVLRYIYIHIVKKRIIPQYYRKFFIP